MNKNLATLCVIAAGTLWGTMGLFVRNLALDGLSSSEMAFFRTGSAAAILFIWMLITNRSSLKIKIKDIWCFIGTGIVSLTFFTLCYFTTIQRTSMSVAAILLYTSPVFVVLFSTILFKERFYTIKLIALLMALVGCVLVTGVFTNGGPVMDPLGILIGIGAGFGYAMYSIFGRYAIERGYDSLTISFYTFVFCSVGLLAVSPFTSPLRETVMKIQVGNTIKDIILIIGMAIVATVLPYLLYTLGLSGIDNGKAGIMASIEPVVATILGIIVYNEEMSFSGFVGIVFVMVAIVLLNSGELFGKKQHNI